MAGMNSARLLHRHSLMLRQADASARSVRGAVGRVFGIEPTDDLALRRAVDVMAELFSDAERRVRTPPRANHERLLGHFPVLRKSLANLHLDNPTEASFNFAPEAALENLDLVAARLREESAKNELEQAERTPVRSS